MYSVYILKSEIAQKSYVGITDNMSRRLGEHNAGKSFYTKRHCPWKLIHEEEIGSLKEARQREKYLKSCAGRRFLKKVFEELE